MNNLVRVTYRTAVSNPITNSNEQANHFGSHLKHWMDVWRNHDITSDEYWRVTNLAQDRGLGFIHTRPCRCYAEGEFCRNEHECQHLHVGEKDGGGKRYRRGV